MSEIKICPFCEETIQKQASVCPFCGESQPQRPFPQSPVIGSIPSASQNNAQIPPPVPPGQPLQLGQQQTPYAANAVPFQQQSFERPPSPPKKRITIIIAAIAAVVVVAIGAGGTFYYFNKKSKQGDCGAGGVINSVRKIIKSDAKDMSLDITNNRGLKDGWKESAVKNVLDRIEIELDDISLLADNKEENKLYCKANVKADIDTSTWNDYADSLNAQASAAGKASVLDKLTAAQALADKLSINIASGIINFKKPVTYSVENNGQGNRNITVNSPHGKEKEAIAKIVTDIAMKNEFISQQMRGL